MGDDWVGQDFRTIKKVDTDRREKTKGHLR